jgi:type I restriction enzyme S subunit
LTEATRHFTGAVGQQRVPENVLANLEIPLPPKDEQRRIAGRLQEQMAAVERARTAVQNQLDTAQKLPAALLRAVFTSPAAHRWPRKSFGELVANFDGVRIPLKHTDRNKREGKYPYYGASGIIDQIDDFRFDGEFLLIGEDGANLLSRSTPIAFRAKGKFWVNNHAHVVQPKSGTRIEWLEHFFAATDLQPFVTGSAQPKLSQGSLNEIPVPVPPPDEQNNLVARLETELTAARALVESLQARLAEIERLPAALLREAFRGGDGPSP